MSKLELVVDAKAVLGEGPSWDMEKQVLYWVDIEQGDIHQYDPIRQHSQKMSCGQKIGAVVPTATGTLLAAMQHGFYEVEWSSGKMTPIVDPEKEKSENRFNDGKCDPFGRFWAGTLSMEQEKNAAALYVMDQNRHVRKMLDGVTTSNGMAWTEDHRTMYYIDSPTKQVAAFEYDLESGDIANRRTVVTIPEGEGAPDGMTIDAEGMIWVAQWGGYKVCRWNPETGKKLVEISLPVARVTSCCFGGKELDVLYITTASIGITKEEPNQPHAGGLYRIKPGVKGTPTYRFG